MVARSLPPFLARTMSLFSGKTAIPLSKAATRLNH